MDQITLLSFLNIASWIVIACLIFQIDNLKKGIFEARVTAFAVRDQLLEKLNNFTFKVLAELEVYRKAEQDKNK